MGQFAEYAEVGEYWNKERPLDTLELLENITSRKFHDMMDDRMLVSHYKYGSTCEGYPEKSEAWKNIEVRVAKYHETGNVEYLIDAANFCMIEFMHPSHPKPFLKATDSNGSPGIAYRDGSLRQDKHSDVDIDVQTQSK